MSLKILNYNQIEKEVWDEDIMNPAMNYDFLTSFEYPLFIINPSTNFKWCFFIKKKLIFKFAFTNVEPVNFNEKDFIDSLSFLENENVDYFNFYSVPLLKFENKDILEKLKFDKIFTFGSNIINLKNDKELIWNNIHSKHRNVIRKAERSGVLVKEDDTIQGFKKFYELLKITYKRSNKKPPSFEYLKMILSKNKSGSKLFFAIKDKTIQAGAFMIFNNKTVLYLHGASIDKPFTGSANYLHWKMINYFKNMGLSYYDFGGVNISAEKNSKVYGINRFKLRFGGDKKIFYGGIKIFHLNRYRMFNILKRLKNEFN